MVAVEEITKEQLKSVATEINFLRLPLFKTTKVSSKRTVNTIDYKIDKDNYHIEISTDAGLTAFDRKVLIVLEYLYIQQNPLFLTNKLVTNFSEIARLLGISGGNAEKIWESLSKLRSVEISASVQIKEGSETKTVESEFNLLYAITRVLSENEENKRKYTTRLELLLNDWHVDNFRNNYYRIVNLGLVVSLRSGIAVRLFDYLNYKAFYYDTEAKKYRQKTKVKVAYSDLVQYLHISDRYSLKEIKKQFRTPFLELKEKGVLKDFYYEKTPRDFLVVLLLSRSINWRETKLEDIPELPKIKQKIVGIKQELVKYGLSNKQIANVIEKHTEKYIRSKIKQLEYLLRFASHKIKGQGTYLYQSIIDDWKDDLYGEYLKQKEEAQGTLAKKRVKQLEEEYEQYVSDYCESYYNQLSSEEKDFIENEIKNRLGDFKEKVKGTHTLMSAAKRAEILRDRIDPISFKEFCDKKDAEKSQLLLFENS